MLKNIFWKTIKKSVETAINWSLSEHAELHIDYVVNFSNFILGIRKRLAKKNKQTAFRILNV